MGEPFRPSPARQPLAAVVSHWAGDPDIAAAYSYLRPGGTPADRDVLAEPPAPGLHLAGEATWSAHPGTMHGAVFSGRRAARRVLAELPARGADAGELVVVVGAGLAGLAAARALVDGGQRAVVLEAGTVAGGRARADTTLGVPVHLGAAWAHGAEGNPIAELAARAGVAVEPTRPTRRPTVLVGRGVLSESDQDRLEQARDRVEAAIDAQGRAQGPDQPLGPVARRLVEAAGEDADDRLVLWSWARSEYEGLYSAPIDDLSLRYRAEPFMLPGDNLTLLGSLDLVVAELARGLDVRYGQRVRSIEATAALTPGQGVWSVVTEQGLVIGAQAVVVTVSVGVLAAGRLRFAPTLPARVLAALDRIGPGRVAKVVATFPTRFWAPWRGFSIVARPAVPLPGWIDVSDLAGVPALAAFATSDAVAPLEASTPDELMAVVARALRHAPTGDGRGTMGTWPA